MKTKKFLSLFLSTIIFFSIFTVGTTQVFAANIDSKNKNIHSTGIHYSDEVGNIYWDYDDKTSILTIKKKNPNSKNIKMPNYSEGSQAPWLELVDKVAETQAINIEEGITSIGDYCFNGLNNLRTINAPDVTYIGKYAFSGCNSLSSLDLGSKNTTIGVGAFSNCSELLEAKGTGKVKIYSYAFAACDKLRTFYFPQATLLGSYCFEKNELLKTIKVPNATINRFCFSDSSINNITVGSLEDYALYENTTIKTINISNAKKIGDYALSGCNQVTGDLKAPNVATVGKYAFEKTKLTSVSLNKVKVIGDYAFAKCNTLTKGYFGNSLIKIGKGAFLNCQNLSSSLSLKNVKIIDSYAFANCKNIGCNSLGNKLVKLGSCSFAGCSKIKSLYVPSVAKNIGSNISSNVTKVGKEDVSVDNNTERIKIYTPKNSPIYKKYISNKHNKKLLRNAVTSIKISKTNLTLKKGKSYKFKVTVNPSYASHKNWTISTTNKNVVSVSGSGTIKGINKGTCYVSFTSRDGSNKVAKCKVRVC